MRRSRQEITDKNEIEQIIRDARTARIALNREGAPYIVPMSFGYSDGTFYFHCAAAGLKTELLKQDPRVCIEIDDSSELVKKEPEKPCSWGVNYRSVIATGTAVFIDSADEKRSALEIILSQFVGGKLPGMSEDSIRTTTVFAVKTETLSAKRSG